MKELRLSRTTLISDGEQLKIRDRKKFFKWFFIAALPVFLIFAFYGMDFPSHQDSRFYFLILFYLLLFVIQFARAMTINTQSLFSWNEIQYVEFKRDVFGFQYAWLCDNSGRKRQIHFFLNERQKLENFFARHSVKVQQSKSIIL